MALGGQGHSFGALASVDIYDPTTGIWRTAREFRPGRFDHTANMLGNSVVLAGGAAPDGYPVSTGNFFDPVTGSSRKVKGLLLFKRSRHTGTELLDGSVLIAGGWDATRRELTATEILPR
jgi:hypothetical protein